MHEKNRGIDMKVIIFFSTLLLFISFSCASDSVSNLKKKAEKALNKKDYSQAVQYLEKALVNEPENQEIHYYLGQAYRLLLFDDGSKINNVNPMLAAKASEHFQKVIEISPRYEGRKFVVGPYSKIQGIWGAVGMTYLYKGKIDSARWAFEKGQSEGAFYPAIMEYNKNIMASCEKDAIIFTNGDNDTYPMWFLQLVEGYRRDITVVNLSLLNVPWYIKQLKNGYPFGDNNIPLNLSDEEIDAIKYKLWKETEVQLTVGDDPLNPEGKLRWIMKPTLGDKIIRVQDIMVMEILKSNNWDKPVYFSTTVSQVNKIGIDEYLAFEGLVFRLMSHKDKVSLPRLKDNCVNVYTYNGVNDKHYQYIEEVQSLYRNYRVGFIHLAISYSDAGQKDEAKEILEIMNNKLPEGLIPYPDDQTKKEVEALYEEVSGEAD
jgi:tetratricopeptide (TPR) repeat protein